MSSPISTKKKDHLNEDCLPPLNGIVRAPIVPPSNRPGRMTDVLDEIKVMVNALMRNPCSLHFRKPLGTNPMDLPNYHMLIKRPMDLSTILRRLNNNYYWQGKEAVEDVKLIFENCRQFHQEGSKIYEAGEELKSVFHRYLASIDMTREKEVHPAYRLQAPVFIMSQIPPPGYMEYRLQPSGYAVSRVSPSGSQCGPGSRRGLRPSSRRHPAWRSASCPPPSF